MGLFNRKQQVVDLRDSVLEEQQQRPVPFEFGFPTTCPDCGGRGYLDHIDPFKRLQFEHCPQCSARWERSEDQVLSMND